MIAFSNYAQAARVRLWQAFHLASAGQPVLDEVMSLIDDTVIFDVFQEGGRWRPWADMLHALQQRLATDPESVPPETFATYLRKLSDMEAVEASGGAA
jgi:hypothetical protein